MHLLKKKKKNNNKGFKRLQNSALKTILRQFQIAHIAPIKIEVAISLIRIQFDKITKFYSVRVLKLQSSHLIRALIKPPK
jgi:Tol biopolymer transport system component